MRNCFSSQASAWSTLSISVFFRDDCSNETAIVAKYNSFYAIKFKYVFMSSVGQLNNLQVKTVLIKLDFEC